MGDSVMNSSKFWIALTEVALAIAKLIISIR